MEKGFQRTRQYNEPPDKSYVTHLALTALCSYHKKRIDYLTPNYLIPSQTIRLHALWKSNEADELTKLARKHKLIHIIANKACCNCGKLNEYERYFVFKEDCVDYEKFQSIGKIRERSCGCPSGEITKKEKKLGGWEHDPLNSKLITKKNFPIQHWHYDGGMHYEDGKWRYEDDGKTLLVYPVVIYD